MVQSSNEQIIRQYFAAVDAGQLDILQELLDADYQLSFGGMPAMNTEAAIPFFGVFLSGFPDLSHTIHEILVDGDRAAARITVNGTHDGEFMGVPPTGKPIVADAMDIFHFRDGKVRAQWIAADSLGILQQIGAIPAPGGDQG